MPLPDNSAAAAVASQLAATILSPSQHAAQGELAGRVADAIALLGDTDREVLLMRTFEGLSYDEVACVLDIDSAAARKRHGRALLRLHKVLTDGGLTESKV
jgi:RNA polymerase sigma factor (sigma-70 family)